MRRDRAKSVVDGDFSADGEMSLQDMQMRNECISWGRQRSAGDSKRALRGYS